MIVWTLRLFAALGLIGVMACQAVPAAELTITCGPSGTDVAFCLKFAQAWARKTGHTVKNFSPPSSVPEKLALYRQLFAAKSSDIDVLQIDLVWPGLLKDHLLDLRPWVGDAPQQHFASLIEANTVNGRLLALPWYSDAGLLYFRQDLLTRYGYAKPPQTWDALHEMAQRIQSAERARGQRDFHGFVFQGKADEGLTCHALEWLLGSGAGQVLDPHGEVNVRNAVAAQALDRAARWINDITPFGVLSHEPEDTRGVFQSGHALFMRNWPYAWALMQMPESPVAGKIGVAALPGAQPGQGRSTVGGWQLGVSRYSKYPELAADLVLYLTSAAVQRERAITGAFNPTRPELYRAPEVIAANPHMPVLNAIIAAGVVRPSTLTGAKYPQVSQAIWNATHDVLSGRMDGTEAVARLDKRLRRIRRHSW